jgi:hypothetical protein
MCINVVAFSIGALSGLVLIRQGGVKISIGIFTLFFSCVQLIEAAMHYSPSTRTLTSKLLLLNLGFQGLVFGISFLSTIGVHPYYLFIYLTVAILITLYSCMSSHFQDVSCSSNDCRLVWGFLNDWYTSVLLTAMYAVMFLWVLSQQNQVCVQWGRLLLFTLCISYFLQPIKYSPSIWCLTSAIVSPLTILI